MNELETKTEETAAAKKNPWQRLPKGGKVAVAVLGIVVVLAALAALYVNGKLDLLRYNDGSVSEMGEIGADEDQDLDGTGLTHTEDEMTVPEGSAFADDDVLNILLIGTDERTEAVNDADAFTHLNQLDGTEDTTEFSDDARADSMILVSLDMKDHVIRLVSIERGTGVPILLDGYEDQYDWITHTFRYGGPKLTMKTVQECFNVEVDHFVRVNFNSFVQIVDAVGGVDIDITDMEAKALNWEVPSNSMLIVNHVDPGPNHFDGYTALQYARLRKIDNDWKRVERQRTVIQAVLDQVKNASVVELDNLLNTVLPLIQTNFTKSEIASLLVQLPGFLGCDVQQMSMPLQGTYGTRTGMDDRLMYDPDWAVNIKALQDFLYNDKTAEEVIAATPETAAAEAAGELVIATRETADVTDPVEEYNNKYLHRIDMTYALDDSDFGDDSYRVFVADTDNLRGNELRAALIEKLYTSGVRVVAVPDGAAAGVLLDNYLQTGNAESLTSYLAVLPADERTSARTLWEGVYRSYPGAFHAAGLGADARSATVGKALSVLANASYKTPETEITEAVQALRSGTATDAVYWFKTAMAKYPRQMERFFGDNYAAASRLYYAMQGTLNVTDERELPVYDAKQLLKTYPDAGILIFTDEASALMTEGSMASELQAQLDKQKYADDEEPQRVCAIATVYGTWSNAGEFTPDDTETAWDADSLTEYLGSDALRGKDMLLALDGEDSPYLKKRCLLNNVDAPVGELVQKLFVLDKNNIATEETAETE
ncbi:LCP family protein [Gemmiger sp.]